MKKEERNIVRTGWRIESLEDVLKLKDYSIIGSSLSANEDSLLFYVDIKIGEEQGKPITVGYFILQMIEGGYIYGLREDTFTAIHRPDLAFNSTQLFETQDFDETKDDFNYLRMEIGKIGYQCLGIGGIREFDQARVKQLAFFCLENHYKKELTTVLSVAKPIEKMKITPDETQLDLIIQKEQSDLVRLACQTIQNMIKEPVSHIYHPTENNSKKEVYFGYVYDKNGIAGGIHGPMRILEGKEAVANFVCDEQLLGNDKLITDTFENEVLTTHGMFVHTLGQTISNSIIKEMMLCIQEKQQDLFRPEEELERE